jgi:hypothetical protein
MTDLSDLFRGLERACFYRSGREAIRDSGAPHDGRALTVALDREAGTPAAEVARAVGALLGWPVHDRELLERVARDLGRPVWALEAVDEKPHNWLLDCLEGLTSAAGASEARFFHHLACVIHELGAEGRCVIVGRGAAQILPPSSTLRVLLAGAREPRVAAFRRRFQEGRKEASRHVEEADRRWSRFVAEIFGRGPASPDDYDLVVNVSRWTVAECAELIAEAVRGAGSGGGRAAG